MAGRWRRCQPRGAALLPVAVPADPSFVGATVYSQLLGVGLAGLEVSPPRLIPVH
ncbi:MAG: hypothetical protein ACREIU_10970 [Planctomycetota bacterium]